MCVDYTNIKYKQINQIIITGVALVLTSGAQHQNPNRQPPCCSHSALTPDNNTMHYR
jgi:hypothetical protein